MSSHPLLPRVVFALTLATAARAEVANWPQWRGPASNGTLAASAPLPAKIDAATPAWQVPLPGKGCSTPVVFNNRIYLTAPVGGKDALLAFDTAGKELWRAVFSAEDKGRHRNGSGSNPSPVTDGSAVFVTFKSGNVAAVNLDGSIRWQLNLVKEFGPLRLFWDFGTSPTLTEQHVILARMHEGDSWLAAFDKQTGKLAWKTARNYEVPKEIDNGYTTPLLITHAGKPALLTWGAQHLTAHDAATGKLLWECGGFNPDNSAFWPAVATPVVAGDIAVVCFGRADRGTPRLHGIRLGGSGDVTKTHRVWQRDDVGSFVPSPVEYQGRVYILSDRGQVDCLDPKTGKTLWSDAFPRASSNYYASPLIANDTLYAAREDGAVYVASIVDALKILSETKLSDRVIATPIPFGRQVLLRGEAHLYCFQ